MTNKFQVGDRVTLSGVILSICDDGSASVRLDGGGIATRITHGELGEAAFARGHVVSDTAFRDQAAIAALQGILSGPWCGHYSGLSQITLAALGFANALDAERNRQNGGE